MDCYPKYNVTDFTLYYDLHGRLKVFLSSVGFAHLQQGVDTNTDMKPVLYSGDTKPFLRVRMDSISEMCFRMLWKIYCALLRASIVICISIWAPQSKCLRQGNIIICVSKWRTEERKGKQILLLTYRTEVRALGPQHSESHIRNGSSYKSQTASRSIQKFANWAVQNSEETFWLPKPL